MLQELKAKVFETKAWPEIEALLKLPGYFLYDGEILFNDLDE
jgi:hypothetical protein